MEEYRCLACGHSFPSEEPPERSRCPRCGSARLERNPWLLGTDACDLTPEDYRERVRVST